MRQVRGRVLLATDRAPRLEPLAAGPQGTDPRLHAIRHDERRVVGEERRNLGLVGLELLERRPDRRVLGGCVLEFKDRERKAVDEDDDVRPSFVLALDDRELVDGQPVVVRRLGEVEHRGLGARD